MFEVFRYSKGFWKVKSKEKNLKKLKLSAESLKKVESKTEVFLKLYK